MCDSFVHMYVLLSVAILACLRQRQCQGETCPCSRRPSWRTTIIETPRQGDQRHLEDGEIQIIIKPKFAILPLGPHSWRKKSLTFFLWICPHGAWETDGEPFRFITRVDLQKTHTQQQHFKFSFYIFLTIYTSLWKIPQTLCMRQSKFGEQLATRQSEDTGRLRANTS